ncbi:hypothetical protein MGL_2673 [Malassezia globosa CBS 7966]|uniref:Secreted protein n=1 Tax=Malassezia globosa (strain ATCC MYA-4612 / CBS 7966) TaxID=425265 RepID=A8Q4Y5_MALGO|nr:uncharacterized protein MGL_2673 [Malassezia globosa CBS 7966]EDP43077.1 hypothetical protein MGL_2673 [Malassezia globosa CBS 7966]
MFRFLFVLALALVPFVLGHDDRWLYCFHRDTDKSPDLQWRIDLLGTINVCKTLSSGSIVPADHNACVMQPFDVQWFKKRCEAIQGSSGVHRAGGYLVPKLN